MLISTSTASSITTAFYDERYNIHTGYHATLTASMLKLFSLLNKLKLKTGNNCKTTKVKNLSVDKMKLIISSHTRYGCDTR